ncbi:MAG: hypothetical protein M1821_005073 [Bathelium mastoideum]|nr:MAG: hypothetical protein M1821_005073 [Bathelium mastoideum]
METPVSEDTGQHDARNVTENNSANSEGTTNMPDSTEHSRLSLAIKLRKRDGNGNLSDPWAFAYNQVKTWEGFYVILRDTFGANAESLWEIENNWFKIHAPDSSLIYGDAWNELVEPGWEVTFQSDSDKELENSTKAKEEAKREERLKIEEAKKKKLDERLTERVYENKVSYMLRFLVNERYHYPPRPQFDYEEEYPTRPKLQQKDAKPKKLAIIQEIIRIIHPEDAPRRRLRRRDSNESIGNTVDYKAKGESEEDTGLDPTALGPQDTLATRHLIIHSPLLLNALRAVVCYTSNEAGKSSDHEDEDINDVFETGEFQYPYKDLFLHKDDLREYQKHHRSRERHNEEDNATCDHHIDTLVDYLYLQDDVKLKQAEECWEKKIPTTTFSSLWLLMKPGADVYVKENDVHNAYVIDRINDQFSGAYQTRCYTIEVWHLVFNGRVISRKSKTLTIPVFDGEREITGLPLYPERFHPRGSADQPSLRQQLIERGKRYVRLTRAPSYMAYTGRGLQSETDYDRARAVVDYMRNKITTSHSTTQLTSFDPYESEDALSFPLTLKRNQGREDSKIGSRARMPECKCEKCQSYNAEHQIYVPVTFGSYDDLNPRDEKAFNDHKYFLCDSHLNAFMLKDRIWDTLDVDKIKEPEIDLHAIDKLVMKTESNKDLIKAICAAYTSYEHGGKPYFTDYIEGKGEGQVFLLHGPPGTGKTLTAESVAEFTKRPLLSITTADLGSDPVELERNLLTFFRDANDWDAIVLLDEADVYMERRGIDDLTRNSVVSIFLRALDYFKGILFLTTNRVGLFDDAFMSRIHVQIGYDKLEETARQTIWTNNFEMLTEDAAVRGKPIRISENAREYVETSEILRNLEWNGREIRNGMFNQHIDAVGP